MSKTIRVPGACDSPDRMRRGHPLARRRRFAAVMRDRQQCSTAQQAARCEADLRLRLDVARQQYASVATCDLDHARFVVAFTRADRRRVQHPETYSVPLPGEIPRAATCVLEAFSPRAGQHGARLELRRDRSRATDVIEIAVRQDEQVEHGAAGRTKRRHDDRVAEIEAREVSRPRVVHHAMARGVDDEARALSDVEHRNTKRPFLRRRRSHEQRQHGEQHAHARTSAKRCEPQRRAECRADERRHVHRRKRHRRQHVDRSQYREQHANDPIRTTPQRRTETEERLQREPEHQHRQNDERRERYGDQVRERCNPRDLRQHNRRDRQHGNEQDELRTQQIAQRRDAAGKRCEPRHQHRDGAERQGEPGRQRGERFEPEHRREHDDEETVQRRRSGPEQRRRRDSRHEQRACDGNSAAGERCVRRCHEDSDDAAESSRGHAPHQRHEQPDDQSPEPVADRGRKRDVHPRDDDDVNGSGALEQAPLRVGDLPRVAGRQREQDPTMRELPAGRVACETFAQRIGTDRRGLDPAGRADSAARVDTALQ